jgi:coenzyme F420 biosynthesis associated uncharacterized protein
MVDWVLAQKLAAWVAGTPDARLPDADLAEMARDAETRVVAYTGLTPRAALPPAEGIDRPEWVRANISGMRLLMDPVVDKVGSKAGPLRPAVRIAAGAALTAEVGVILGLMAQRVLGQYELVLLEQESRAPRLLFVMPNLGGAVRTFDVSEQEFVRWVAIHEVTHAVQFGGVPWLQEYLAGLVRTLLDAMEVRVDAKRALSLPSMEDVRRLVEKVRSGDLVALVARPEERATLDRLQAVMAVVEGHAEHVMDAVGEDVLPSLPQLREALERRRSTASAPARLLQKLLGLEMKMRQYKQGKAFCDAVVAAGGIERLNDVWRDPSWLPSGEELVDPSAWLRRTETQRLSAA